MFCFADDGGDDGYWWRQVGSGGLCVLSRDGESSRVCVCVYVEIGWKWEKRTILSC